MKKILFYLPALAHTGLTLCLNILSGSLIPLWHMWNILFWLSGLLLSRGRAWGCLFGLIPAGMVLGPMGPGRRGLRRRRCVAGILSGMRRMGMAKRKS